MIQLYTWGTPNGKKVSIMLEEIGMPYEVHPINLGQIAPRLQPVILRIGLDLSEFLYLFLKVCDSFFGRFKFQIVPNHDESPRLSRVAFCLA